MTRGQGSSILWCGIRQELLRAEGAAASFGQWEGEVVVELRAQEELTRDGLTEPWDPQWMALLVQWLLLWELQSLCHSGICICFVGYGVQWQQQ